MIVDAWKFPARPYQVIIDWTEFMNQAQAAVPGKPYESLVFVGKAQGTIVYVGKAQGTIVDVGEAQGTIVVVGG
jgi:hypothetical protein